MTIGVFSCDPGGHTGLAWAILDPGAEGGAAEALRTKQHAGSSTVVGDERSQIRAVTGMFDRFYTDCRRRGLLMRDVWFVCENFVQVPGMTAGGVDSTVPLALIWGIEGYKMGRADLRRGVKDHQNPTILQQAGQALSLKRHLKDWDCWVVGKEHERSAYCHLALFLKRYIIQHGVR